MRTKLGLQPGAELREGRWARLPELTGNHKARMRLLVKTIGGGGGPAGEVRPRIERAGPAPSGAAFDLVGNNDVIEWGFALMREAHAGPRLQPRNLVAACRHQVGNPHADHIDTRPRVA